MSEYLLKPPGKRCVASGRELRPGGRCRSALVERDDGPARLDYDLAEWAGPPEGEELVGHWLCRIPGSTAAERTPPDPAELLARFTALDDAGPVEQEKLRYALAVELLRHRRLELEGTEPLGWGDDDGPGRTLLLADVDGGDRHRVPDFAMTAGELAAYREAVFAADDESPDGDPA